MAHGSVQNHGFPVGQNNAFRTLRWHIMVDIARHLSVMFPKKCVCVYIYIHNINKKKKLQMHCIQRTYISFCLSLHFSSFLLTPLRSSSCIFLSPSFLFVDCFASSFPLRFLFFAPQLSNFHSFYLVLCSSQRPFMPCCASNLGIKLRWHTLKDGHVPS